MSIKLSLPFAQDANDDLVLSAGESDADTVISDGTAHGLHFTPDDWRSILDALYGSEIGEDELSDVSDGAGTWEVE